MPRAFNFYQGTGLGTGIFAPKTHVDFFTGKYFPLDLSFGQSVGFLWPASEFAIPSTLTVSGSQETSNKQIVSLGVGIYGFISPLLRESGNIFISVSSGNIQGVDSDIVPFKMGIQGQASGDNVDRPILKLLFNSGDQISGSRDVTFLRHSHTGEVVSGNSDTISFRASFYGQFTLPDSDNTWARFRMDDITYEDTTSQITVSNNTGMFIRFRMDTIIYDDAV